MKIKENELIDKYLDLARELKTAVYMMVKGIVIVIGTGPKVLEETLQELEIRLKLQTIENTALRSARRLRKVLVTYGNLLLVKLQWKTTGWWEKIVRSKIRKNDQSGILDWKEYHSNDELDLVNIKSGKNQNASTEG